MFVKKKKKKLWLRQVIVPNINDNEEYILKLKDYIKNIKYVEKVELLPYQDLGKTKYHALNIPYRLEDTPPMDTKRCDELQKLLED